MNKLMVDTAPTLNRCILEELRSTLIWDALIPKGKLPKLLLGGEADNEKELKSEILTHIDKKGEGEIEFEKSDGEKGRGYIRFKKTIRTYDMQVSTIKSPYTHLSDLNTHGSRNHVLTTVQAALRLAVGRTQHRRLETSFERTSGGIITCDGTHKIQRFAHGDDVTTIDPSTVTQGLSGGDIQAAWDRISRITDREQDYGRHDGEPQHALVMGSNSFPSVEKGSPFMDSKLFPLKYSHSIRSVGPMIHIVNTTPPRYTEIEGKLVRVEPFTPEGNYEQDYDTAEFEVAYALHKSAMEYQVPSDDPENYLFDAQWMNIDEVDPLTGEELNPLGDKGFFLLTMVGAMCPRNVDAAITLIYRRA